MLQSDVARKFGLTQPRVSQIVHKMIREQTQLQEQIGQPLGRASQRLIARQADRICKQQALSWCQRHLESADKPLTTTRTRKDGEGKTLFTEETVREVKPNLQLPKLMVRLSSELAAEAHLPPPPADDERRTAAQRRRDIERLEEENAMAELTRKAEQLAEDAKARQAGAGAEDADRPGQPGVAREFIDSRAVRLLLRPPPPGWSHPRHHKSC